jgi:hypothetical protein
MVRHMAVGQHQGFPQSRKAVFMIAECEAQESGRVA